MRRIGDGAPRGTIPGARQPMSRIRHTPADEPYFLIRTLAAELRDGDAYDPHAHPWGQLIYVASGVVTVRTEHGTWVAPPSWAVWAPRGVAHALQAAGATALRTLYLRPTLRGQPRASGVVAVSPLLRELILRAVALGMLDRRDPMHAALATVLRSELREVAVPSIDLRWPTDAALRPIAAHIANNPSERDGHAALAQRFGMSVRTLERGFVRATGLSLGHWARQARLQFALRRLGAGAAVKVAATDAGYTTPSAFVAAFKGVFGTTPGRYFVGPGDAPT